MGADHGRLEVNSVNIETFILEQQVSKPFENMFVVFISSNVVITNLQIHEWEDMQRAIDGGGGHKLTFER
jgi:hypothetical protein